MRLFSAISLLALLTVSSSVGAQCNTCISLSSKDDACPLRSSGPLSKSDIAEASKMLSFLEQTKEELKEWRETSDSSDATIHYRGKPKSGYGCYQSSYRDNDGTCLQQISLGTNGDVREMVTSILKARIEKATCRLRSIGVDIPKP